MSAPADAAAALPRLPRLQLRLVLGGLAGAAVAGAADVARGVDLLAPVHLVPLLALVLCFGILAAGTPRDLPLTLAGTVGVAALLLAGAPPLLSLGAAAGARLASLAPWARGRLDLVHGALVGAASLPLAWWATAHHGPLVGPVAAVALGVAALSHAPWPSARRHDHPDPPSAWQVARLPDRLRAPAHAARRLYREATSLAPDVTVRRGLREVADWVIALQHTRLRIERELARLPEAPPTAAATDDVDPVVRGRREATARHHARLGEHRDALDTEARRLEALSTFALAWLEDARASLGMGALRPGAVEAPDDLDHVLARLRDHARSSDAARRTAHELVPLTPRG